MSLWLIAGDARLGHLVQRLMPVSSPPAWISFFGLYSLEVSQSGIVL